MHQEIMQLDIGSKNVVLKKTPIEKLQVTERDLTIFDFLLEMKIAGIEEIYSKFFPDSSTLIYGYSHWARDRLAKLRFHDYLGTIQFPDDRKRYYFATEKARRLLIRRRPLASPPWGIRGPGSVSFPHDLLVLQVRLLLEKQQLIQKWVSDRHLKIAFGDQREFSLEKLHIPDGIFTLLDGTKVALEVERTQKAISKYREKVKYQVSLIRSKAIRNFEFDQVLYLCTNKAVFKTLEQETKVYGNLFRVRHFQDFLKQYHQSKTENQYEPSK